MTNEELEEKMNKIKENCSAIEKGNKALDRLTKIVEYIDKEEGK